MLFDAVYITKMFLDDFSITKCRAREGGEVDGHKKGVSIGVVLAALSLSADGFGLCRRIRRTAVFTA